MGSSACKVSKANQIVCSSSQAVDTDEGVVANSLESDSHLAVLKNLVSPQARLDSVISLTLDTITQ